MIGSMFEGRVGKLVGIIRKFFLQKDYTMEGWDV
jgi:hypothetical protein